jgi:hypothetical protein
MVRKGSTVRVRQRALTDPLVDGVSGKRAIGPTPNDDGPILGIYESGTSAHGYFEEDASLWSRDGTLLAQSRQLALLR